MKKILLFITMLFIPFMYVNAEEDIKYVATINDVKYENFDIAVSSAKDGDVITLLDNVNSEGMKLSKNLTIDGNSKYTITFENKGIGLWGVTLKFKNVTVNMNGVGATPSPEWSWMTICASTNAKLYLENTKMTLDGTGTTSKVHAIYFCSNNQLNLNNSTLIIKNYTQDALEWDGGNGGYNVNLINSTYISDNNRSGFTGTFYATIDNSKVKVINSKGNGSNGTYYKITNNSEVTFENNGAWGISAWRIDMTNNSTLNASNNGYSGIWTRVLNVDSTCTLIANGNGKKASSSANNAGILFYGNKDYSSIIEKGAKVEIKNNAGSGIYTKQAVSNLTILAGEITNNGTGSVNANKISADLGGGIYNFGRLVIGEDVNIYNNHAKDAGDDIYNAEGAVIDFKDVKDNWILDDCNDKINNWYDDSENNRWNAHEDDLHIEAVKSGAYETKLELKAAHNLKAKVISHYVDQDGNTISEDVIVEGFVEDKYKTEAKDITGYVLNKIDGSEEGTMTKEDIHVTYIYEFVHGTGDTDEPVIKPEPKPTPDIPYTGIEETENNNNTTNIILMSSSLTLLVGLVVLRKKFN